MLQAQARWGDDPTLPGPGLREPGATGRQEAESSRTVVRPRRRAATRRPPRDSARWRHRPLRPGHPRPARDCGSNPQGIIIYHYLGEVTFKLQSGVEHGNCDRGWSSCYPASSQVDIAVSCMAFHCQHASRCLRDRRCRHASLETAALSAPVSACQRLSAPVSACQRLPNRGISDP